MKENFYKNIVQKIPIGYAYFKAECDQQGRPCDCVFLEVNDAFEKITGLNAHDIVGERVSKVFKNIHNKEFDWINECEEIAQNGGSKEFDYYSHSLKRNYHISVTSPEKFFFVTFFHQVNESEEQKRQRHNCEAILSNLPGMAFRCNFDEDWSIQFVSDGCYELTGYHADSFLHCSQKTFRTLIGIEDQAGLHSSWMRALSTKSVLKQEYFITTASGEKKWVFEQGHGIYNHRGEVEALEGIIIDITDQKKREEEIYYLIYHDTMTGLYNRFYFEIEKKQLDVEEQLPISVIIGDINGLKLINDVLGHAKGDKVIIETAKILESCCRKNDILARGGGDEFYILLPKTCFKTACCIMQEIQAACEKNNSYVSSENLCINISLGCSTKTNPSEDFEQVIKEAENIMYKRKLLEQKSSHSAIISSIKATMMEKSQETEEHAERLVALSKMMGMRLNLSQSELDELVLLAMLHDIGKVGIDERILNKPGKLNDQEWVEMKKHPEIGFRIAMATPELKPIAEYILNHQERWDGKGYTNGLAGKDIPLLSRIIAVVDAYDAMTADRPYRKAMSKESAIAEIRRNAGTQFDPEIAALFIEMVTELPEDYPRIMFTNGKNLV